MPLGVRKSGLLFALCAVFGFGAAAVPTNFIPDLALGIPVIAPLIVLLRCEAAPCEVAR